MGTIKHRITRSLMGIALLCGIAAVVAPATHAAPAPSLTITALHGSNFVYGYGFSNNQRVILRAYGLANGQKVPLASTQVTSIAPNPYTIDFQWDFAQAQDPCNGNGGYLLLEVDAYIPFTNGIMSTTLIGSTRSVASRMQPSLIPYYMPKVASAIGYVQCGDIIY